MGRREKGERPAWGRGLVQASLGAVGLAGLLWLLRRGPDVAPVSLFAAYGSTNGFYSASHVIPLLAAVGAAGALWAALDGRAARPAPATLLVLALPLGALALAAAHAVYPHDARLHLLLAGAFAVLWFGFAVAIGTARAGPLALLALAGFGDWLAVAGLEQFARGQPTSVAWTGAFASIIPVRITASLNNPNVLAAALLLALGAAAGLAVGGGGRAARVVGLAAMIPPALALPLTFSRAAYVSLFALVAVGALLLPRRHRGSGVLALLALALPLAATAVAVPGVLFRAHTISVQGGGDIASRFFSWRDALSIWRAHPLWGAGPGGLETLYARHHAVGDARGTYVLIDVPGSPDSDPLQWLAETGLVGAGALGAALLLALAIAWRNRGRFPPEAAAAAPLLGAVVAVMAQGLLEVTAFVLTIEGLLALAFAALVALTGHLRPGRGAERALALAVAVGGIAAGVALHATWHAQQTFEQGWSAMQAGHPARALPALTLAAHLDPTSERNLAAAGDDAVRAAYAAQAAHGSQTAALEGTARTDLGAALRLDPYDAAAWSAVTVLMQMQQAPVAAACAQQAAVRDTPDAPYQADALASALRAAGQPAAARTDAGYAARFFPLQLAVYREYHEQSQPYYRQAAQDETKDAAAWGRSPLPARPAYPFSVETCTQALVAGHFDGGVYGRVFA